MFLKITLTLAVVISAVFSRASENESELLMVNDENLSRVKRSCIGNLCSESSGDATSQCMLSGCIKRGRLQDDVGPFWANRGKRNPRYKNEPLYADEPHWVLVRRADGEVVPYKYNFEPFFVTRGKKDRRYEEDNNSIIQELVAKMRIRNHQDSEMKISE